MSETQNNWSTVAVAGHRCHIFEPSCPSEHPDVVIYLHGLHLHELRDQPEFGRQFNLHGLRVICPVTHRSWWTDRICQEFDATLTAERYVLDQVVPHIAARWNCQSPQIALLGTSMGGQGALRLSYKHPALFPVVAAISPAIDYHQRLAEGTDETLPLMYHDEEEARQDTATLHVHPLNWPRHQFFCCDPEDYYWWDSADRLRMKLASIGILFECDLETSAGGHGFDYYNAMSERALKFIAAGLKNERLRLPTL